MISGLNKSSTKEHASCAPRDAAVQNKTKRATHWIGSRAKKVRAEMRTILNTNANDTKKPAVERSFPNASESPA
jgi:hypothetical protein